MDLLSKTTLNVLPNEFINDILDHLSLPSLLNVSLTHWHIHDTAVSHVHASFSGRNPVLFLQTIIEHRLAKHVKQVTWTYTNPEHPPEGSPPKSPRGNLAPAERHIIADAFRRLEAATPQLAKLEDLTTCFERSYENDDDRGLEQYKFFEFFLLFLPNVESLLVELHYWK